MSQESNTESNSSDKPKKRLSLKKKVGDADDSSAPKPKEPEAAPISSADKPIRMSFKNKEVNRENPKPEESFTEKESTDLTDPPEQDSPLAEEPPVHKVGLKPKEDTVPPPAKKIPISEADAPTAEEKSGLLGKESDSQAVPYSLSRDAQASSPTPAPQIKRKREPEEKPRGSSGGGTRPPIPPPGMKIRKDADDDPSGPPPVSPPSSSAAPPPVLPAPDLMDEALEAEDKPGKGNHIKGVLVAGIILIILVGGIGFLAWGVLGMFSGEEEGDALEPPVKDSAPAKPNEQVSEPKGPQLATDEPKSFLGKTAKLTQEVSEKASTEEITNFGGNPSGTSDEPGQSGSQTEVPAVTASSSPARDIEPTPKAVRSTGDPEVRAWIEEIRPSGVGRGMMLLDGDKYRLGEIVNPQLNIRWVGLDQQLGVLTFEDPYGVRYEKDY